MPEQNPTPALPVAASTLHLTPKGTPVVPGPQTLDPQLVQLLTAALQTLPPGAGKTLLKQYWGYVLALVIPLVLTTYQNVKEIWQGPAQLAEIRQEYAADHREVEALQRRLDELEKKQDQILWILKQKGTIDPDTRN